MRLWRWAAVVVALIAGAFVLFTAGVGAMKMSNVHQRMIAAPLHMSAHCWIRFLRPTINSGRMKTGRV
jgi:multisubunit Na+/H+ antiporter MnhG subunit